MVQEKGIISTNQYVWILFGLITSFTTLQVPGFLIAHSGRDAWLSITLAWFIDILYAVVYAYIAVRFPKQNIFEYSITLFGKYIGRIIGLFFLLFFLIVASTLIRSLSELLGNLFFPRTPINYIIVIAFITIGFGAKKGLETLARTCEILGPVYLVSLVLLFSLAVPSVDINLLKPQLNHGFMPFLTGAPLLDSFMGICVLMGMLIPYCNKPANGFIGKFIASTMGAVMISLLVIISSCIFSPEQAGNMINPGLQLARYVSIGEAIQRLEAIWLMVSIAAGILAAACFIWAFSLGVSHITCLKNYKPMVYPSTLLALLICIVFFNNNTHLINFEIYVYPFIELFIVSGLGTSLLIATLISKKGVKLKS